MAVDLPEANDPTVGIMALVPRVGHFYRRVSRASDARLTTPGYAPRIAQRR